MSLEEQEYNKAKRQVDSLNEQIGVNEQNLGLGYLDMNSRMLHLEETTLQDKGQWSTRMAEHKRRKERIENYWHSSTGEAMGSLKDKIPKDKKGNAISRKKPAYYVNFTLKDLEILVKNSENGGNSQEYNDVATDLELFNALAGKLEDAEKLEYLDRLAQSCDRYINSRNPFSPQGRRRKAMIQQIYTKAQAEAQRIRNEEAEAYRTINEAQDPTQVPQEAVAKALGGRFARLSRKLQQEVEGLTFENIRNMNMNMEVEPTEQELEEDKELVKIAKALMVQKVGADQSPILSTRFFNAIGWSKRTPAQSSDFDEDVKKSPIKVKLYHTINALKSREGEPPEDAGRMMSQLVGETKDSRQYMSFGTYGKGTYTAARGIGFVDAEEELGEQLDKAASDNSWTYGKNPGSMQVTMTFNKNVKAINFANVNTLCEYFSNKYPEFYQLLDRNEENGDYTMPNVYSCASMILAFFGYNTVYAPNGSYASYRIKGNPVAVDYYVTFDRSAFTVDPGSYAIRNEYGDIK